MEDDITREDAAAVTTTETDAATITDGRFTFSEIHRYLRDKTYPVGYSKADKTALRKRANFFVCKGSDLFYVGGQSSRTPEDRREPRLVIEDAGRRKRIVASLHDSSHLGVNRTLDLVTEKYYWPGLTAAVKDYVSDFDHNY